MEIDMGEGTELDLRMGETMFVFPSDFWHRAVAKAKRHVTTQPPRTSKSRKRF